jgi:nucleotide-binding universal stress UspA family protein
MYETILIPTDGSLGAERGVKSGLDIARQYDATVHALFVVDERIYGETPGLSDLELRFEQVEERGEEFLRDIETRCEELGLDVQKTILRGMPYGVVTVRPHTRLRTSVRVRTASSEPHPSRSSPRSRHPRRWRSKAHVGGGQSDGGVTPASHISAVARKDCRHTVGCQSVPVFAGRVGEPPGHSDNRPSRSLPDRSRCGTRSDR